MSNAGQIPPFSTLVEQAIELAAQWHDGTYRKSRWRDEAFGVPEGEVLHVPAMAHATAVAMAVQRAGWDDTTVAAAFLHDALEDPNRYGDYLSPEVLRLLIGEEVTGCVLALTERKFDAMGRPRTWRERKEDYVEHLLTAPERAIAISLADKQHNLWTINNALERGMDVFVPAEGRKKLSAGPSEQIWFHRAVLDTSRLHTDARLVRLRAPLEQELHRFERRFGQAL